MSKAKPEQQFIPGTEPCEPLTITIRDREVVAWLREAAKVSPTIDAFVEQSLRAAIRAAAEMGRRARDAQQ